MQIQLCCLDAIIYLYVFDKLEWEGLYMRKTIIISSIFPATPDTIWPLLLRIETLRYITAPYAKFTPVNPYEKDEWCEGTAIDFRLWIFGFIPFGIHTILVQRLDESNYIVTSREKNRLVPIWNHTISLVPMNTLTTSYTDEVELNARWLTQLVYLWARVFYKHRQKKWLLLLNRES
jgi:hypothetical protein